MSTLRSRRSARTEGASRDATRGDEGAGLLGTSLGVFLFLVLLLVAVQVAFDLYARSAVGAAAFDAARAVAAAASVPGEETTASIEAAEARARAVLGGYGDGAEFEWEMSEDAVVLTVRVANPSMLPPALRLGDRETERTVRMRMEREI